MKNLTIFLLLLIISCEKKEGETNLDTDENSTVLLYDTIAKDSFSAGATSVDVARKIRISSKKYQDSLRENLKKIEAEKLAKKEAEEKEKVTKKMEEEKKKREEESKSKKVEKTHVEILPVENLQTP